MTDKFIVCKPLFNCKESSYSVKKSLFKKLSAQIDVKSFLDYSSYLNSVYQKLKSNDESFSHKKFAVLLGFSPSNITIEYIKGRRPISKNAGEQISKNFGLKGSDRRYFLNLLEYVNNKSEGDKEKCLDKLIAIKQENIEELDKQQLDFYKNWLNIVMLELVQLKAFKKDFVAICKRFQFGATPKQLEESYFNLIKIGMIKEDENGEISINEGLNLGTGHRVKGIALKKFHSKMLENAKMSLFDMSGKDRDVSSVTISVDEKTAMKIREMIHEFQVKILAEAEQSQDKENVYQLNFQYFPFLKRN